MSAREQMDAIDVDARVIDADAAGEQPLQMALANGESLELRLVPALAAQAEIAKANPALALMRKLVVEIKNELPTLNVATKEGEKRARELRASCVSLRTSTDKAYEAWNKPLLEAQRGIRAVVKEVAEGVAPVETQLDTLIKNIDAAREAEKLRKFEAEQARIAALRTKIEDIMGVTVAAVKLTSAEIDAKIRELQDLVIEDTEESFGEFSDEASGLRGRVIGELLEMSSAKRAQEDQAASLERQRQEQLEAERQATARRALQAKIDAIKAKAFDAMGKTAAQIQGVLEQLQGMEPLALEFGDLWADADAAWRGAVHMVTNARNAQRLTEEQAESLRREQAELQRQRDEQAAAERARAQEAERQAQAEAAAASAKAERDARIEQRIQNLRQAGEGAVGSMTAAAAESLIAATSRMVIDEDNFGDRVEYAEFVRQDTLAKLRFIHAKALEQERQQAEERRQAEAAEQERAAAAEAAEARALDSEAETFEEVAQNIITTLQLAGYPCEFADAKLISTLLTDERVLAQLRAIKERA